MGNETPTCLVLLVEDNELATFLTKDLLEKSGFIVHSVFTGEEALFLFEEENYPLVLLNVKLPGIDGLLTAQEMRLIEKKQNRAASIIIAFTGYSAKSHKEICLTAGMDEFIQKPFTMEHVIFIKQLCQSKTSQ